MTFPHWKASFTDLVPKLGTIRPSAIQYSLYPTAGPTSWLGGVPTGSVLLLAPESTIKPIRDPCLPLGRYFDGFSTAM